jgi:quercetin dioxygenase-like cupin family protein
MIALNIHFHASPRWPEQNYLFYIGMRLPYKVKRVETVVKSSDVQVREFTLAAGEVIPWHYHPGKHGHYFVLEGILSISSREPDVMARNLPVGSSHKIAPGTPHLITNGFDANCRFLLVQGVGAYDWNAAD